MKGKYESVEIMLDYENEKIVTLAELTPHWWLEKYLYGTDCDIAKWLREMHDDGNCLTYKLGFALLPVYLLPLAIIDNYS